MDFTVPVVAAILLYAFALQELCLLLLLLFNFCFLLLGLQRRKTQHWSEERASCRFACALCDTVVVQNAADAFEFRSRSPHQMANRTVS